MLYVFKIKTAQDFVEPDSDKRLWIDISSSALLARGHLFSSVRYGLGRRLATHLERKGHTVLWF